MISIEDMNNIYKGYDIEFKLSEKRILVMFKKTSRRDELPILEESFTLNISTNKRLIIGVVGQYAYAVGSHAQTAVYPVINGLVQKNAHVLPIEKLSDLNGVNDGSSNISVIGNTLYTDKVGSWIGKGGANVKMLSKLLGRVEIKKKD